MRAERTFVLIGLTLLVTLPLALPAQTAKAPASTGSITPFIWLGADEQPLPFQSAEEMLAYLRTAEEISSKPLSTGITKARRLHLSKGGIEARVVFHHIDRNEQEVKRLVNDNVVGGRLRDEPDARDEKCSTHRPTAVGR
jgi:hypothetical protein